MFYSAVITTAMQVSEPASTENVIRYLRGQMLDFDPGTHYRYPNFGYAVLGRIIERVTGMSYEQYVRLNVLAAMGITRMRIGNTLPNGRLSGEVTYYGNGGTGANVFGGEPRNPPWPYGGWCLECMDAHGGWVSSVTDYAKFMNALDGRRGKAFLTRASIAAITERPSIPDWNGQSAWYGFGIMVRPSGDGQNWWHNGSLDGTTTYQVRTGSGFQWVVV